MERKNFKAPDNIERYVALTSGHTFRIAGEWVNIPEFAWQDCYAAGCISEDILKGMMVEAEASPVVQKIINKEEEIRAVLKRWIEDNEVDNFTTNGSPKITKLNTELGWRSERGVVTKIWFEIQESK